MKIVKLEKYPAYHYRESGSETFILKDRKIVEKAVSPVQLAYQEGLGKVLALKVFFKRLKEPKDFFIHYPWGRPFPIRLHPKAPNRFENSGAYDALRVQNLCSYYNLAPRVYRVVFLQIENRFYPAIVTDYLGTPKLTRGLDKRNKKVWENIVALGKKMGFRFRFEDANQIKTNIVAERLVDFEGGQFLPFYEKRMTKRYVKMTAWGGKIYQGLEELKVEGWRDEKKRERLLGKRLRGMVEGRVVWDVGCNGGYYSRRSEELGAEAIFGIDFPSVVEVAAEVSSYLGYFRTNYIGRGLGRGEDILDLPEPDTIFYLSMQRYLGYPPYLKRAKTVIYEHNGDEPERELIGNFRGDGFSCRVLGESSTRDRRRLMVFERSKNA